MGPYDDIAQRRLARVAWLSASASGLIGLYCAWGWTDLTPPGAHQPLAVHATPHIALDQPVGLHPASPVRQADFEVDPQESSVTTVEQVSWMSRVLDPVTSTFGRSQQGRGAMPASAKIGPMGTRRQRLNPGPQTARTSGPSPRSTTGSLNAARQQDAPERQRSRTLLTRRRQQPATPPSAVDVAVASSGAAQSRPSTSPPPKRSSKQAREARESIETATLRPSAPSRLQPDQMVEPEYLAKAPPTAAAPSDMTSSSIRQASRLKSNDSPSDVTPVPARSATSSTNGLRQRAQQARQNGQAATALRLEAAADQIEALTGPLDPPRRTPTPQPSVPETAFTDPVPVAAPAPIPVVKPTPVAEQASRPPVVPQVAWPKPDSQAAGVSPVKAAADLPPRIRSLQSQSRRLPSLTEGTFTDLSESAVGDAAPSVAESMPADPAETAPQIPSPPGWSAATKLGGKPAPVFEPIQVQSHSTFKPVKSARPLKTQSRQPRNSTP